MVSVSFFLLGKSAITSGSNRPTSTEPPSREAKLSGAEVHSSSGGFPRSDQAEAHYALQWQRALDWLEDRQQSKQPYTHIDLWDVFAPFYSCPLMERVGSVVDGGKWMCARRHLLNKEQCNIYSLGSNGETSFEVAILADNPGCKIHIYDHTLTGKRLQKSQSVKGAELHLEGMASEAQLKGLANQPGNFTSLMRSMRNNHIKWLDVLKIDIEGWEWPVFAELLASTSEIPITQVLIELHAERIVRFGKDLPSGWETTEAGLEQFFMGLHRHRFRAFSAEPNLRAQCRNLIEYSFIKMDDNGYPMTGPVQTH
jgi:hypothetical protein